MSLHPTLLAVTDRIRARSQARREAYLARMQSAYQSGVTRHRINCTNVAHAQAAMPTHDKLVFKVDVAPNIGIITSYNDMLSAHQPFEHFPELIKAEVRAAGATAQVAGGVPAMCDGVTQGQRGMELSMFSRDVIAMSTAVALAHNVFDASMLLGVCDKIVPGLLIGALRFGHLPAIFVPAGPMTTGLSNSEKAKIRQLFAEGKADRDALLESEMASYHGPGTCTFYGTANSNQMLMEIMGLQLPGSSFVNPGTPLREALTRAAARQAVHLAESKSAPALCDIVDERTVVNGIVGLLATGGSTNHTIHLVAIARAAGIEINWDDFSDLSADVPLLARVYPNGKADINHFHAAGGMGYLIRELLDAGLLHEDVETVLGSGLRRWTEEPWLDNGNLAWRPASEKSHDPAVLAPASEPFSPNGGLALVTGNLGRGVIKLSAVAAENHVVRAPAIVFDDQQDLIDAFKRGELERDFIAVVRFQGPRANGMPELHQLTPTLAVLQDRGFQVALVTDGRMSGASGKVPAAIHISPECAMGGPLAKVRTGDMLLLNAVHGRLEAEVPEEEWERREIATADLSGNQFAVGRELFSGFRQLADTAERGCFTFHFDD
ncbi:phosphogluconate dehydratase [Methylocaldum sp.]|uniref:phosphogluconate dehydratase n=1 Tax=Methylocaldum sp. TaxID=1969727 RepID=UPI002D6CDDA0|nr:phosphogluconate dehydratase [Methylocaldum sp.]HYE35106.1 phosphogluconate dehydratase [Methylocaldum sp.]